MKRNRVSKLVGLVVALAAVALLMGTAQTREEAPEAPPVETAAACDDAAPAEAIATSADAACKPCKDRTWCKCTYNGMARASCDPCCYRNNIGVLTCLD